MNKSTKILLAAFVVLLGVYLLFFRSKDRVSSDKIESKLFVADSSKIDKIEITKANELVTVEKINGLWRVTKPVDYPADTNAITPILGALKNFRIEGVASENPEKFGTYLDSALHTKVTAYQEGKMLGTFEVGKTAVSAENAYIKIPDQNRILIATGINAQYFSRAVKDYRTKYITSIPFAGIKTIRFQSSDSNKVDFEVLQDSANHWVIGKDSIQHVYIDAFLNLIGNMNTDDFKDSVITTFPAPTYTITINGAMPTTINFYKENTTPVNYIMSVSNVKQLFRFSEPMTSQWFKKRADFIPPPPPAPKKEEPKKK